VCVSCDKGAALGNIDDAEFIVYLALENKPNGLERVVDQ
jgi:hypothetical protein